MNKLTRREFLNISTITLVAAFITAVTSHCVTPPPGSFPMTFPSVFPERSKNVTTADWRKTSRKMCVQRRSKGEIFGG